MNITTHSAYLQGITGRLVKIEAQRTNPGPGLRITGLPEEPARRIAEHTARVAERLGGRPRNTAVDCRDIDPGGGPLHKLKDTYLDGLQLPIILAVLATHGGINPMRLAQTAAWAAVDWKPDDARESRCGGNRGAIPIAKRIAREKLELLIADEYAMHAATECATFGIKTIEEAIERLKGDGGPPPGPTDRAAATGNAGDYKDWLIRREDLRILAIAAAGGHHIRIEGTEDDPRPTRYGRYIHRLLPDLTDDEGRETGLVHSAAGLLDPGIGRIVRPPLRAPHYTASTRAMTGSPRGPGEASLAHNGVLLLDEATEFARETLDSVKTALKLGSCAFYPTWAPEQIVYPSRCLLVTVIGYEHLSRAKGRLKDFLPPGVMHLKSETKLDDKRMDGEEAREKAAKVRARLARTPASGGEETQPNTKLLRTIQAMNDVWSKS